MCFYVPTAGAIITTFAWRRSRSVGSFWLMLMFLGGALFGVVDHWWNGELFLVSGDLGRDLMLGVVITATILVCWWGFMLAAKKNQTLASYVSASK
ncbi:hypothetical protein ACFL1K_03665 [Candidatus Omnitrophota bacterium]